MFNSTKNSDIKENTEQLVDNAKTRVSEVAKGACRRYQDRSPRRHCRQEDTQGSGRLAGHPARYAGSA
jgi:hypothetical protein